MSLQLACTRAICILQAVVPQMSRVLARLLLVDPPCPVGSGTTAAARRRNRRPSLATHLWPAVRSIRAVRGRVWLRGGTSARLYHIQLIGRWSLMGMLLASLLALANSWFLDTQITRLLVAQSTARAMDHVQLGIVNHVSAEDFLAPHTREQLADIRARLNPTLTGLRANASGMIDVDLIAADGTILYSNDPSEVPGMAGLRTPPGKQWLLDEALAGRVTTMLEVAPQHPGVDGDEDYDRTFDIYVPVSMGGLVVGAYELDVRLPPTRLNQPILMTLVGGMVASGIYLLLHVAGAPLRRRHTASPESIRPTPEPLQPKPRPMRPTPAIAQAQRESQPDVEGLGCLTRRELDVLQSLALGHSYREIASELIVGEETIRSHVKRILRKTGQPNRTALVTAAHRAGLIDTPAYMLGPGLKDAPRPTPLSGTLATPLVREHPPARVNAQAADSPARVIAVPGQTRLG